MINALSFWDNLVEEFNSLGGFETLGWQIIQILLATLLGAVFGMERELRNKPAGFITFMLVSMGSCLFGILQKNIIGDDSKTRVIAQVVSGIGFLGAGTILHNRGSVKGITTAALLWVSAAVGLLVGTGGIINCTIAVVATVVLYPLTLLSRKVGRRFMVNRQVHRVYIVFEEEHEKELYDLLASKGVIVKKTFFHNKREVGSLHLKEIYLYFSVTKKISYQSILDELASDGWIHQIEEA